MGSDSKIEWTTHTFNPWRGCTKVSEGCRNCYADALSKRNPSTLGIWGPSGKRVVAAEGYWREPLRWNTAANAAGRRDRVFCASLADWLEGPETMPPADAGAIVEARARLLSLIRATPSLDWLLLTKRPEGFLPRMREIMFDTVGPATEIASWWMDGDAPGNVWVGTSVEDQAAANERIPHLLRIPARVRFLSCEPLLGPVDLEQVKERIGPNSFSTFSALHAADSLNKGRYRPRINWVIVGGESGGGSRPMHPDWARTLRDQCQAAGVKYFFKQWGDWAPADEIPEADPEPRTILPGTPAETTVMEKPPRHFQWVRTDGGNRVLRADGRFTGEGPQIADAEMFRVGKKGAGRSIDGREWNELPEVR
jgi:protein gp37